MFRKIISFYFIKKIQQKISEISYRRIKLMIIRIKWQYTKCHNTTRHVVYCQISLLSIQCAVEKIIRVYCALFANTEQVKTTSLRARSPRTEWVTARFAVFPPPPCICPAQATCIGAGVSYRRRCFSIVLTRSVSVYDSLRCHHLSSLDSEHFFVWRTMLMRNP